MEEKPKLITYPNPILRKKALPIKKIDEKIFQLVKEMEKTLFYYEGLGLAANQIGALKSLFIVNLSNNKEKPRILTIINPEIIKKEGEVEDYEGCLSIPNVREIILRPKIVVIKGITLDEKEIVLEGKNLLARCFLHEYEHLCGILFIDHLSEIRKKFILNQIG
ncbi:MAG: peptide deformylase [candidate division WOR-3 bacterium]|nr:peptide deformylase [candidate division WOR-3 bacterium]MDW8113513.1 peptide deformylase [candidate division WOR-3 bacterium]